MKKDKDKPKKEEKKKEEVKKADKKTPKKAEVDLTKPKPKGTKEDAKDKKNTMDAYWVPGVNALGTAGRWAFAEFTDIWSMQSDFKATVEAAFNKMMTAATAATGA